MNFKNNVNLKIIDESIETKLPAYATDGSSGMDVYSTNTEDITLLPGERKLFPLNFAVEIRYSDSNYEIQVRSKSGLALKHGISVLNSPGTIDYDFRGEVGIILINHGHEAYTVKPLQKIAQIVLQKIEKINFRINDTELKDTARGDGGFGSTGVL